MVLKEEKKIDDPHGFGLTKVRLRAHREKIHQIGSEFPRGTINQVEEKAIRHDEIQNLPLLLFDKRKVYLY